MKIAKYLFLTLIIVAFAVFFVFFRISDEGVSIKEQNRPLLKKITQKISQVVYDEATKHNPEGDFLPDQLDDSIKNKIKDTVH